MSVLGQKQTYAVQNVMSALSRKADMCGATWHVRHGSRADICTAKRHVRFTPESDRKSRHGVRHARRATKRADAAAGSAHLDVDRTRPATCHAG
jgi:hypothetical protein